MNIKTIEKESESILIIEKSKFIAIIFPCPDKESLTSKISQLKKKYYDATHVCYGSIILEDDILTYKSNDDGEPSSTAGAPILNVLKKNNLANVAIAVVRYFGGIKLGAGGLTRAYSNSAIQALNEANIVNLVDAYSLDVVALYQQNKNVEHYLKISNIEIANKTYDLNVTYSILLYSDTQIEKVKKDLSLYNATLENIKIVKVSKSEN